MADRNVRPTLPLGWQPEPFGNVKRIPQVPMRDGLRDQVANQVAKSAPTLVTDFDSLGRGTVGLSEGEPEAPREGEPESDGHWDRANGPSHVGLALAWRFGLALASRPAPAPLSLHFTPGAFHVPPHHPLRLQHHSDLGDLAPAGLAP